MNNESVIPNEKVTSFLSQVDKKNIIVFDLGLELMMYH